MQQFGPHNIGTLISIASVRNWILELKLTEADTVMLHPVNFDNLVLEYRQTYGQPMPDPYFLLGALVDEAGEFRIPKDLVLVLLDDDRPRRMFLAEDANNLADDDGVIYRCRYCGNIMSSEGEVLDGDVRRQMINLIKLRGRYNNVVAVHGLCCPEVQGE